MEINILGSGHKQNAYSSQNTVKLIHVTTTINQSLVLKGYLFLVPSYKKNSY